MSRANKIELAGVLETFDQARSREIEKAWMRVFCRNDEGCNTAAFKWHIFSSGRYPSVEGGPAERDYALHVAHRYVVMTNRGDKVWITGQRPDRLNRKDVHVFPENLAWTMAFTHEEGWLGPYFARHPNYAELEAQNDRMMEKQRQKVLAAQRGWA